MINFKVFGKIQPKERPRFDTRHGFVYTPKATINSEQAIRNAYIESVGDFSFGEKPVYLIVYDYRLIPQYFSKKKRELAINNEIFPDKKPDVDNITKTVMDALIGVAYVDDSKVISAPPIKLYSKKDMAYIDVYMCEMSKKVVEFYETQTKQL